MEASPSQVSAAVKAARITLQQQCQAWGVQRFSGAIPRVVERTVASLRWIRSSHSTDLIHAEASAALNELPQKDAPAHMVLGAVAFAAVAAEFATQARFFAQLTDAVWSAPCFRDSVGPEAAKCCAEAIGRCLKRGPPQAFAKLVNAVSRGLNFNDRRFLTVMTIERVARLQPKLLRTGTVEGSTRGCIMDTFLEDATWRLVSFPDSQQLVVAAFAAVVEAELTRQQQQLLLLNKEGAAAGIVMSFSSDASAAFLSQQSLHVGNNSSMLGGSLVGGTTNNSLLSLPQSPTGTSATTRRPTEILAPTASLFSSETVRSFSVFGGKTLPGVGGEGGAAAVGDASSNASSTAGQFGFQPSLARNVDDRLRQRLCSSRESEVLHGLLLFEAAIEVQTPPNIDHWWPQLVKAVMVTQTRYAAMLAIVALARKFPREFVREGLSGESKMAYFVGKLNSFCAQDKSEAASSSIVRCYRLLVETLSDEGLLSAAELESKLLKTILVRFTVEGGENAKQQQQPSDGVKLSASSASQLFSFFAYICQNYPSVAVIPLTACLCSVIGRCNFAGDMRHTLPVITQHLTTTSPVSAKQVVSSLFAGVRALMRQPKVDEQECIEVLKVCAPFTILHYPAACELIRDTLLPFFTDARPLMSRIQLIATLTEMTNTSAAGDFLSSSSGSPATRSKANSGTTTPKESSPHYQQQHHSQHQQQQLLQMGVKSLSTTQQQQHHQDPASKAAAAAAAGAGPSNISLGGASDAGAAAAMSTSLSSEPSRAFFPRNSSDVAAAAASAAGTATLSFYIAMTELQRRKARETAEMVVSELCRRANFDPEEPVRISCLQHVEHLKQHVTAAHTAALAGAARDTSLSVRTAAIALMRAVFGKFPIELGGAHRALLVSLLESMNAFRLEPGQAAGLLMELHEVMLAEPRRVVEFSANIEAALTNVRERAFPKMDVALVRDDSTDPIVEYLSCACSYVRIARQVCDREWAGDALRLCSLRVLLISDPTIFPKRVTNALKLASNVMQYTRESARLVVVGNSSVQHLQLLQAQQAQQMLSHQRQQDERQKNEQQHQQEKANAASPTSAAGDVSPAGSGAASPSPNAPAGGASSPSSSSPPNPIVVLANSAPRPASQANVGKVSAGAQLTLLTAAASEQAATAYVATTCLSSANRDFDYVLSQLVYISYQLLANRTFDPEARRAALRFSAVLGPMDPGDYEEMNRFLSDEATKLHAKFPLLESVTKLVVNPSRPPSWFRRSGALAVGLMHSDDPSVEPPVTDVGLVCNAIATRLPACLRSANELSELRYLLRSLVAILNSFRLGRPGECEVLRVIPALFQVVMYLREDSDIYFNAFFQLISCLEMVSSEYIIKKEQQRQKQLAAAAAEKDVDEKREGGGGNNNSNNGPEMPNIARPVPLGSLQKYIAVGSLIKFGPYHTLFTIVEQAFLASERACRIFAIRAVTWMFRDAGMRGAPGARFILARSVPSIVQRIFANHSWVGTAPTTVDDAVYIAQLSLLHSMEEYLAPFASAVTPFLVGRISIAHLASSVVSATMGTLWSMGRTLSIADFAGSIVTVATKLLAASADRAAAGDPEWITARIRTVGVLHFILHRMGSDFLRFSQVRPPNDVKGARAFAQSLDLVSRGQPLTNDAQMPQRDIDAFYSWLDKRVLGDMENFVTWGRASDVASRSVQPFVDRHDNLTEKEEDVLREHIKNQTRATPEFLHSLTVALLGMNPIYAYRAVLPDDSLTQEISEPLLKLLFPDALRAVWVRASDQIQNEISDTFSMMLNNSTGGDGASTLVALFEHFERLGLMFKIQPVQIGAVSRTLNATARATFWHERALKASLIENTHSVEQQVTQFRHVIRLYRQAGSFEAASALASKMLTIERERNSVARRTTSTSSNNSSGTVGDDKSSSSSSGRKRQQQQHQVVRQQDLFFDLEYISEARRLLEEGLSKSKLLTEQESLVAAVVDNLDDLELLVSRRRASCALSTGDFTSGGADDADELEDPEVVRDDLSMLTQCCVKMGDFGAAMAHGFKALKMFDETRKSLRRGARPSPIFERAAGTLCETVATASAALGRWDAVGECLSSPSAPADNVYCNAINARRHISSGDWEQAMTCLRDAFTRCVTDVRWTPEQSYTAACTILETSQYLLECEEIVEALGDHVATFVRQQGHDTAAFAGDKNAAVRAEVQQRWAQRIMRLSAKRPVQLRLILNLHEHVLPRHELVGGYLHLADLYRQVGDGNSERAVLQRTLETSTLTLRSIASRGVSNSSNNGNCNVSGGSSSSKTSSGRYALDSTFPPDIAFRLLRSGLVDVADLERVATVISEYEQRHPERSGTIAQMYALLAGSAKERQPDRALDCAKRATELEPHSDSVWRCWAELHRARFTARPSLESLEHALGGLAKCIQLATSSTGVHCDILSVMALWRTSGDAAIATSNNNNSSSANTTPSRCNNLTYDTNEQQSSLSHSQVRSLIMRHLPSLPIHAWREVIPQLVALMSVEEDADLVHEIIAGVFDHFPDDLVYALIMARDSTDDIGGLRRSQRCTELLKRGMTQTQHARLIGDAELVALELKRLAVPLWKGTIQRAVDICVTVRDAHEKGHGGKVNVERVAYELAAVHDQLRSPRCVSEALLCQRHAAGLVAAEASIEAFVANPLWLFLQDAHRVYVDINNFLESTDHKFMPMEMQNVSPRLFGARNLALAVPTVQQGGAATAFTNQLLQPAVRIACFGTTISVMRSKQAPRVVLMHGTDGVAYRFLVKGGEDLRLDERVMHLFGLINALLREARHSKGASQMHRQLFIERYNVTPLSSSSGLIGWVNNVSTMHDVVSSYREGVGVPNATGLEFVLRTHVTPELPGYNYDVIGKLTELQQTEVFEYVCDNTSGMDMKRAFWVWSPSTEQWLDNRTLFSQSAAVTSIAGYLLGLGDRHVENLMISRSTNKVVHIDFGECFEENMKRRSFPERVPFRLTRMMRNAMDRADHRGHFRAAAVHTMGVARESGVALSLMMEAFLHDPLVNWQKSGAATAAKMGDGSGGNEDMKCSLLMQDTLRQFDTSGLGYKCGGGGASGLSSCDAPGFFSRGEGVTTSGGADSESHFSEDAIRIVRRVRAKLAGRDFYPANPDEKHPCNGESQQTRVPLSTEQQVELIVDAAVDPRHLATMWVGWFPWW